MFKKVLVPVDLAEPEFTREALKYALRELRDGAEELQMITVVPAFSNALVASYFSQKDHTKAVEEVARDQQELAIPAIRLLDYQRQDVTRPLA